MQTPWPRQKHPPCARARIVRGIRKLKNLRGWRRLVNIMVPETSSGEFCVRNQGVYFAGNLASYIDRNVYLYGGYEDELIDQFLALLPPSRRRTVLDVGANVGTHSVRFARYFGKVHSFEPNSNVWISFERNMALNCYSNVVLHRLGLADRDAELTLQAIDKPNHGLGTFSDAQRYDLPLKPICSAKICAGDSYLKSVSIDPVDAIKIDVQGFEAEVVKGLMSTLASQKPFVWLEVSESTFGRLQKVSCLSAIFPFKNSVYRFTRHAAGVFHKLRLLPADGALNPGDYVVAPDP